MEDVPYNGGYPSLRGLGNSPPLGPSQQSLSSTGPLPNYYYDNKRFNFNETSGAQGTADHVTVFQPLVDILKKKAFKSPGVIFKTPRGPLVDDPRGPVSTCEIGAPKEVNC